MPSHVWQHPAHPRQRISIIPEVSAAGEINRAILLAGRLLFGGFFLYSGIDHFMNLASMIPYAANKGIPFPEAAILFTGLMLVVGGISVLLGYRPHIGA